MYYAANLLNKSPAIMHRRFTHDIPVDVPVFIIHSESVLLCLLGSLLDLVVLGSKLTDDPHAVLGGSTPPLPKLRLPLMTLTLLLKQFL